MISHDPNYPTLTSVDGLRNYKRRVRRATLKTLLSKKVQGQLLQMGQINYDQGLGRPENSRLTGVVLDSARRNPAATTITDEDGDTTGESHLVGDENTGLFLHGVKELLEEDLELQVDDGAEIALHVPDAKKTRLSARNSRYDEHDTLKRADGWFDVGWDEHQEPKSKTFRKNSQRQRQVRMAALGVRYCQYEPILTPTPHETIPGAVRAPGPPPLVPGPRLKVVSGEELLKPCPIAERLGSSAREGNVRDPVPTPGHLKSVVKHTRRGLRGQVLGSDISRD
ncbi:hypothetical protein CDV36_005353 [Fusarium kuroshium]|uniref:Uncharacterized protein n=1 Tax=Fusarium kuroshium TaxID=2010991 RepID=A0A3M2SBM4_9HYPO|nr:hypothetical protein CDV36_005353 [Fusarium kuroshium]